MKMQRKDAKPIFCMLYILWDNLGTKFLKNTNEKCLQKAEFPGPQVESDENDEVIFPYEPSEEII